MILEAFHGILTLMAYQFKLQVPISKELNEKLKYKAKEVGFGSVNDVARLLLTNFANGNLFVSFFSNPSTIPASKENIEELERIITEGMMEYKQGKAKSLDLAKPISKQLLKDLD